MKFHNIKVKEEEKKDTLTQKQLLAKPNHLHHEGQIPFRQILYNVTVGGNKTYLHCRLFNVFLFDKEPKITYHLGINHLKLCNLLTNYLYRQAH